MMEAASDRLARTGAARNSGRFKQCPLRVTGASLRARRPKSSLLAASSLYPPGSAYYFLADDDTVIPGQQHQVVGISNINP
jgi:hypothetical protein